jgi:small subunit ribosomal protein S16
MPAKIRLARHGKKKKPFYHIVIADSRAPRDGKFIERIGIYNPNTNPATIDLNFDSALDWLQKGAQPTDTCRAILSYKGVLYKNHLLNGVKKGAFSEEEVEKRFQLWRTTKEQKIQAKRDSLSSAARDAAKKKFEAEAKVNETRAEEIAKRQSKLAEELVAAEAEAKGETVSKESAEQPVAEEQAPATEETSKKEEKAEAPTKESK